MPVPTTASYNQTVDRIDQNIGDKIRLYVRAHWQKWNVFGGNAIPVNGTTTPTTVTNYTVGYTHTLTPNLVNDFRVGRNFFNTATVNPFAVSEPDDRRHGSGNPGFQRRLAVTTIPAFRTSTSPASTAWATPAPTGIRTTAPHQLSEQISWTHGAHNIMAGMEFRRLATGRAAVNSARGTFTFNGTLTGYAPADFILGHAAELRHAGSGNPRTRGRMARRLLRARQMAGVAQTDAQLRPPLRTAHGALYDQRRTPPN